MGEYGYGEKGVLVWIWVGGREGGSDWGLVAYIKIVEIATRCSNKMK